MFKTYDDPEPPACLRYMMNRNHQIHACRKEDVHTWARPECFPDQSQEALPQVLALCRHRAKISRTARRIYTRNLVGSFGLRKCFPLCTSGIPVANGGQALHLERASSVICLQKGIVLFFCYMKKFFIFELACLLFILLIN